MHSYTVRARLFACMYAVSVYMSVVSACAYIADKYWWHAFVYFNIVSSHLCKVKQAQIRKKHLQTCTLSFVRITLYILYIQSSDHDPLSSTLSQCCFCCSSSNSTISFIRAQLYVYLDLLYIFYSRSHLNLEFVFMYLISNVVIL